MPIERRYAINAEPIHDGKAGTVHNGEVLISPFNPDLPGGFQVGRANRLNQRDAAAQAIPKPVGGLCSEPVVHQRPRFDEHMVSCDQRFLLRKQGDRATVWSFFGVRSRKPNGCIDEEAHLA
jgi:hypothetical protein